ncbi:MAG: hypothetical protein JNM07_12515 [Phycisphaerae bacterium]|nr:hypothetical protein [Phycisphaerae bacterium]
MRHRLGVERDTSGRDHGGFEDPELSSLVLDAVASDRDRRERDLVGVRFLTLAVTAAAVVVPSVIVGLCGGRALRLTLALCIPLSADREQGGRERDKCERQRTQRRTWAAMVG